MKGYLIPLFGKNGANIIGDDGKAYFCRTCAPVFEEKRISFDVPGENACAISDDAAAHIKTLRQGVRKSLSDKRYFHSFRVSRMARAFAEKFGYSSEKAEIAGLLHDVAKENSNERNLSLIRDAGMPLASFEQNSHPVTHAYAGAVIAKNEFGIDDTEILNAIKYHSGKPDMDTAQKIIFLADYADKFVHLGLEFDFFKPGYSLDDAVLNAVSVANRGSVNLGIECAELTELTMNYILRERMARGFEAKDASFLTDEIFDKALKINIKNALKIKSAANARHISGYECALGRKIAPGLLFRSGRLNALTEEDAESLRREGVKTVIDLRTAREAAAAPDKNVRCFEMLACPLPSIEFTDYKNKLLQKYFTAESQREKAFYLSEFMAGIDMRGMYENVLTAREAILSLKNVFEALARPEKDGILLHCTSGKDRTGIVVALIMLALGASIEDVKLEYYASAISTFAFTESMTQSLRKFGYGGNALDEARYFGGIGANISEGIYKFIVKEYGSVEGYLSDALGVDKEKTGQLKQKYLINI